MYGLDNGPLWPISQLEYSFLSSNFPSIHFTLVSDFLASNNGVLKYAQGSYDLYEDSVVLLSAQPSDILTMRAAALNESDLGVVFIGAFLPR